jgi:hypothetical protein
VLPERMAGATHGVSDTSRGGWWRKALRLELVYHASSVLASILMTASRFSMRLLTVSVFDWGSVATR